MKIHTHRLLLLTLALSALLNQFFAGAAGFTLTGAMSVPRTRHTATLLQDGRVLVAGGYNGSSCLASAEIYDPATGLWNLTTPMNSIRGEHTATLLPNGKVLVIGGRTALVGWTDSITIVELFDPSTATWQEKSPLIWRRFRHSATLLPNGNILVAGGGGHQSTAWYTSLIYNLETDSWVASGDMATTRSFHQSALLPNGTVMVTGHAVSGFGLYFSYNSEVYSPITGTWQTNANSQLSIANYFGLNIGSSATLLFSGKVLIAGGQVTGDLDPGNSSYLFDYTDDTWTKINSMSTARNWHTSTLLPDGRILVAGGFGTNSVYTASAETYDPTNAA
jgi:hypothetical protein